MLGVGWCITCPCLYEVCRAHAWGGWLLQLLQLQNLPYRTCRAALQLRMWVLSEFWAWEQQAGFI